MVRAPGCGPGGRGFETPQPPHFPLFNSHICLSALLDCGMTTRWIEDPIEILTVSQMYRADAGAIKRGVTGLELMERAGAAIAHGLSARWPKGRVVVLCGPGNNDGDGFVAARLMRDAGRDVRLALLGQVDDLSDDAAA